MCTYTTTTNTFSNCQAKPVKHHVGIRIYALCESAQKVRKHCADSAIGTDALLGSSKALGQCPTCTSGTVEMVVSELVAVSSLERIHALIDLDIRNTPTDDEGLRHGGRDSGRNGGQRQVPRERYISVIFSSAAPRLSISTTNSPAS